MMKIIRFALLSLAFVLSGTAFGQSNLPACIESDVSKWSNCTGQVTKSNFIYSGAFLNGKFHGFGVLDVLDPVAKGQKYVGDFKNGEYNGQGTYTIPSGDKYVGEFKDFRRNGQGTLTLRNGNKYVGEFKDDKFNGLGTYTFVSGSKYVGEFKNDLQNGQATFTSANGDKYVGEYKDGKRIGQGTFTFANGNKYVGEFKDDKFNGQGTLTFANGNKYVGEFKDDKFNGQGTVTSVNGDKHVGEYKDDKRNGLGTFTSVKGEKYFGEYKDNKRNGQGISITAEVGYLGGILLSDWIDGKPHGQFIRYKADKQILFSGTTQDGQIDESKVDPNDFKRIATSISDAFNEVQERESQRLAEDRRRREEDNARRIAQINQQEKEEIRKKVEYQNDLVIENNKKFGSTGVVLHLNYFNTECLQTVYGKGLGFGLCTMQGLDFYVSASVRNNLKIDIKDMEIECKYLAQSGTDLTPTRYTRNKVTIYERLTPGQIKDISFKIGGVQQTKNLNCKVLTWK